MIHNLNIILMLFIISFSASVESSWPPEYNSGENYNDYLIRTRKSAGTITVDDQTIALMVQKNY